MISENSKAPDFKLEDHDGNTISLSDYCGKKVILYFYPKDNTPGCTAEACNFRDFFTQITAKGAVILGVSSDSGKSHRNFREKYSLPFPLLCDPDFELAKRYGAFGEKKMYGKSFLGVHRSTFIINEEGNIEKVFAKVKAADHGQEVYDYLNSSLIY
ncbi:MAG: thioredoxin-dependent thiol peroxidase [Spirochaetales bacterium]|nr:thioredoxin-dependent thiol peroxidase [Spirochaetales bacterium]